MVTRGKQVASQEEYMSHMVIQGATSLQVASREEYTSHMVTRAWGRNSLQVVNQEVSDQVVSQGGKAIEAWE